MPKTTLNKLSEVAVRTATYKDKPRKLFVGGGLYLHVQSSGRYWRLKFRYAGKEKLLALGVYPDIGLSQARKGRDAARKLLAQGTDPSAHRRAEKQAERATQEQRVNTFELVAREWLRDVHRHRVVPKHAAGCLRRLEMHVFPTIGSLPVREVTAPQLLAALRVVERAGRVNTAHRLRALCGQVFRYAIATERAERNPAADLADSLRARKERHHAALVEPNEIARLLRSIEGYSGQPATLAALRLAPILFVRPGELRKAQWEDFDLEAGMWDFRPSKGGSPLTTPLPRQAVGILRDLHTLTGPEGFIFPSLSRSSRPMSENTVNVALHTMGFRGVMTGHGFRAAARTILVERLNFPAEWIEMQLGHAVRDATGRAYNRTTFLEQRRGMLQAWADYLDELRSKVVPIAGARTGT